MAGPLKLTWLSTRLKTRPPSTILGFTSLISSPLRLYIWRFPTFHDVYFVPSGPALGRTRHPSHTLSSAFHLPATTTLIWLCTYPYDPSRPDIQHVLLAYLSFDSPRLTRRLLLSLLPNSFSIPHLMCHILSLDISTIIFFCYLFDV